MKIALTGGIACGKSLLARYLSSMGVATIDADDVVHELEAPGGAAVAPIVELFGKGVVGHGLKHIIQRLNLITLDRVLRGVCDEKDDHVPVRPADQLRGLHPVHLPELDVHEQDLETAAVGKGDLRPAGKHLHVEGLAGLLLQSFQVTFQDLLVLPAVLDNTDRNHNPLRLLISSCSAFRFFSTVKNMIRTAPKAYAPVSIQM